MPWIDSIAPVPPNKIVTKGFFRKNRIEIKYTKKQTVSDDLRGYIIYASGSKDSINIDDPTGILEFTTESTIRIDQLKLPPKKKSYLWITAIDQQHNESSKVGRIKIRSRK